MRSWPVPVCRSGRIADDPVSGPTFPEPSSGGRRPALDIVTRFVDVNKLRTGIARILGQSMQLSSSHHLADAAAFSSSSWVKSKLPVTPMMTRLCDEPPCQERTDNVQMSRSEDMYLCFRISWERPEKPIENRVGGQRHQLAPEALEASPNSLVILINTRAGPDQPCRKSRCHLFTNLRALIRGPLMVAPSCPPSGQ